MTALKLTPEQPADILLSAQIAVAANDLPSAEQAYRRYLATAPDDLAATSALAHVLLAQRHPAAAEALLTPALAQHPGDPSFTAQLVQAYLDSGDPGQISQAAPLLQKLHATHPGDPNITRLLARVYVETGHPDQADPLYAALIDAQAAHPDPTLLDDCAEALLRLHRPAEAEKLLKQAVADPAAFPTPAALADAATHLAFAAAEIDDPRMTLQALTLRATVQPPSPSSLFLEATANDALHQSSKAVELYKQFLAAAQGTLPDQESQARLRLAALESRK
jgi:predicted Zn-dependent protease